MLRFVTTGKKCPFYKRNMCYGTLLRNTPHRDPVPGNVTSPPYRGAVVTARTRRHRRDKMNRHDRRRQRAMDRENRFRIAQPVPTIFLAPFHPFASPIRKIRKSKKLDRRKSSGIPDPEQLRPMRRRSRGYARRHRLRCCLNFLTLLKIQAPEVIRAV